MLEMGARFSNDMYMKSSLDPDNGDCYVTIIMKNNEGEEQIVTGTVTWDE